MALFLSGSQNFCLVSCFVERPGFYKVEPYAFRIKMRMHQGEGDGI